MPNLKAHCKISKNRTGEEYKELHEWTDESQKYFKQNHRVERHTLTDIHLNYIKNRWGEKAVIEWLFHIAIDNLETASVWAHKCYWGHYDKIQAVFNKKGRIKDCKYGKSGGWITRVNKTKNDYVRYDIANEEDYKEYKRKKLKEEKKMKV